MKALSVKQFAKAIKAIEKNGATLQDQPYRIYLVREGEIIFYVGQSYNPHNRLQDHLGIGRTLEPSSLGKFILDNLPTSAEWIIEQYTLEECKEIVASYRREQNLPELKYVPDEDEAEEAMIWYYRPCINVASNPNPTPLPERYAPYKEAENPYGTEMEKLYGME